MFVLFLASVDLSLVTNCGLAALVKSREGEAPTRAASGMGAGLYLGSIQDVTNR